MTRRSKTRWSANQVIRPGVTMYRQMSMPGEVVTAREKVVCRSHTTGVVLRGDCNTVRLRGPGSGLEI